MNIQRGKGIMYVEILHMSCVCVCGRGGGGGGGVRGGRGGGGGGECGWLLGSIRNGDDSP